MRQLTLSVAEKDVELERMKTTLVALTKKLNLVNEIHTDHNLY